MDPLWSSLILYLCTVNQDMAVMGNHREHGLLN